MIRPEDLTMWRALGVKRLAFHPGTHIDGQLIVAEVEFYPSEAAAPTQPEAPPARPGFERRVRAISDQADEQAREEMRVRREHAVLFASTSMVPHITSKE